MDDFFVLDLKTAREIRDLLKSIDRKLDHIVEQNRHERHVFYKEYGSDEDEQSGSP